MNEWTNAVHDIVNNPRTTILKITSDTGVHTFVINWDGCFEVRGVINDADINEMQFRDFSYLFYCLETNVFEDNALVEQESMEYICLTDVYTEVARAIFHYDQIDIPKKLLVDWVNELLKEHIEIEYNREHADIIFKRNLMNDSIDKYMSTEDRTHLYNFEFEECWVECGLRSHYQSDNHVNELKAFMANSDESKQITIDYNHVTVGVMTIGGCAELNGYYSGHVDSKGNLVVVTKPKLKWMVGSNNKVDFNIDLRCIQTLETTEFIINTAYDLLIDIGLIADSDILRPDDHWVTKYWILVCAGYVIESKHHFAIMRDVLINHTKQWGIDHGFDNEEIAMDIERLLRDVDDYWSVLGGVI